MERLFEPTFDFDMLCSKGKLLNGISRRRIIPSMPNEGHLIEKKNKIYAIGEKVAKIFNLTWLYDCDCMTDKKGKIKIIEINPRMSGSLATAIISGYPIIDNLLRLINKMKLDLSKPHKKVLVMPYKTLHKN